MSNQKNTLALETIQLKANDLLEKLEAILSANVPQKGDSIEDCQYTAIRCAINSLEACFTGLTQKDLKPDEDWEYVNRNNGYQGL